jgi:hypothetical protein
VWIREIRGQNSSFSAFFGDFLVIEGVTKAISKKHAFIGQFE